MKSFVEYSADCPFNLLNLPYGIFRANKAESFRVGVAIGAYILDLAELEQAKLLEVPGKNIFAQDNLNTFMSLGYESWRSIRHQLQKILSADSPILRDNQNLRDKVLIVRRQCELKLPIDVPNYTDFFAGKYHAEFTSKLFRPNDPALKPNWYSMPIAYNGRSSSIIISGTPIKRPYGQILNENFQVVFSASKKLDMEVELGFVVGVGNELGQPITVEQAEQHIFGAVLLNDWSARDIQQWEYVPLGPFLGKSFATSISPWVVSMFALQEFMVAVPPQEPPVLDYLSEPDRKVFDIDLAVSLKTKNMDDYQIISSTNAQHLYWTHKQMLAHHTSNGCNMQTGDIFASGTISGPELNQTGSFLEIAWNGTKPIKLSDNTQRAFLEDGDSLKISGHCQNSKGQSIGFGEVEGRIQG